MPDTGTNELVLVSQEAKSKKLKAGKKIYSGESLAANATPKPPKLRCLSLGWGVQSTTLAFMSALGELPKLDVVFHADTSWEREMTYKYAEKYTPWLEAHGIPVITATSRSARGKHVHVPAYLQNDKKGGSIGTLRRQCTTRWKVEIVRQLIRQESVLNG